MGGGTGTGENGYGGGTWMLDHATYMYVCLVMSLIGSLFTMLVTLILPCALFPEHCERENNPVAGMASTYYYY
ncbi:hypothetical protein CFP56_041519 [Quercus suber]|uniref:Uncharacterized protein n=1 Tax=Quercus suber TaxID=58331 RepID=A0AAW0IV94_QUESU